jgi:hypothetical protein
MAAMAANNAAQEVNYVGRYNCTTQEMQQFRHFCNS